MEILEEMKTGRGGFCHFCGKDISGPEEKDHTLCNWCWWNTFGHSYIDYNGFCEECGGDDDDEGHAATNPYQKFINYGKCANCGKPLNREDDTVHPSCINDFLSYLAEAVSLSRTDCE